MSWYYTREPGAEGSILTDEGDAPGVLLSELLTSGRPPLKASLEIASAVADILTIAEEDEGCHGDIKAGFVRVDASGGVSLEGYGQVRRTSRAPEGRPEGVKTDVYGLGVVLHSLMSDETLGRMPKDPDDHDDAVVSRVLSMDFSEVSGRRWLEDVRRFLCQILAYDLEERPDALDTANVLATVADQCPGSGLAQWAPRAVRRAGGEAAPSRAPVEETLRGPSDIRSPLPRGKTGQFKPVHRQAPSSKGESTQMWSRDRIAAMLQDEDDDWDEELDAPRQLSDQWQAEELEPPTPVAGDFAPPPRQQPPRQQPPRQQPAPPAPAPPAPAPPAGSPPVAQGPVIQGPVAEGPTPPAPPPAKEGSSMKLVVLGIGCLAFACLGLAGASAIAWMMSNETVNASLFEPEEIQDIEPSLADLEDLEDVQPRERIDSDEPDPAEFNSPPEAEAPTKTTTKTTTTAKTTAKPSTKTTTTSKPASTTSSTTKSSQTTSTKSSTESTQTAEPDAVPPGTPYEAKISLSATEKAEMRCGDGQVQKFAGAVRLKFVGEVNCVISLGSSRGVVTVTGPGQYICGDNGSVISCSSP